MTGGPAFVLRFVAFLLGAMAILAGFVELARRPMQTVRPVTLEAPLSAELDRCGYLPIETADTDVACKALWSEMRRRFLASPAPAPDREAGR